jgi:hypothetical protein
MRGSDVRGEGSNDARRTSPLNFLAFLQSDRWSFAEQPLLIAIMGDDVRLGQWLCLMLAGLRRTASPVFVSYVVPDHGSGWSDPNKLLSL